MDPYSTHVPLLEFLLETLSIKSVLELGVGNHSTALFRSKSLDLTSVEPDVKWAEKMTVVGHKVIVSSLLQFACLDKQYDLAFVDGNPSEERALCVQELCNKANIIIAHDTEPISNPYYHYDSIVLPDGFVRIDYVIPNPQGLPKIAKLPWTSVFTDDQKVISAVNNFLGDTS